MCVDAEEQQQQQQVEDDKEMSRTTIQCVLLNTFIEVASL